MGIRNFNTNFINWIEDNKIQGKFENDKLTWNDIKNILIKESDIGYDNKNYTEIIIYLLSLI